MAEPLHDTEKFDELLVYVATKTRDDEKCGDTKLNKLLYFADVTAYRRRGEPISGAPYQHQPHGPIATPLMPARKKLVAQERLRTEGIDYHGYEQLRTIATDEIKPGVLNAEETAIIDEVIARFDALDGSQMEAIAHQEPSWQMTQDDEEMTYRSSLIAQHPSSWAMDQGEIVARKLGRI